MNETTKDIVLDLIDEPPVSMRTDIDRDEVFDLANDIKKNGLISPITVRPRGARYEVVAGHRRLLAHRYGGIASIRCIVRELTDDEAFAIMTSENLARVDVNPVDEAMHTKRLFEKSGGDLVSTAAVLNRSTSWVTSRLLIADMADDLKEALRIGKIKIGVALALAEITDSTDRTACLGMAISQGASVVVAQYWVAQWRAGLFGHATENNVPDSNAPGGQRKVIMLRCSVDGNEYPAEDMTSVLVARKNVGYLDAMREHLKKSATPAESSPVAHDVEPVSVSDSGGGGNS